MPSGLFWIRRTDKNDGNKRFFKNKNKNVPKQLTSPAQAAPEQKEGAELPAWLGGSVGPGKLGWQLHAGVEGWGGGKLGARQAWPWWKV